jgi:hypothetical protein
VADDFVLVDVMRGGEIDKAALLGVLESGQLVFESIEPDDCRMRRYGITALITGRTRMKLRYAQDQLKVHSRYTHVYVERDGGWRMVAAQGTQIVEE